MALIELIKLVPKPSFQSTARRIEFLMNQKPFQKNHQYLKHHLRQ